MVDFNLKSWRVVVVVAVISAHSSSANFYSFDGNNFSLNFINITRPRKKTGGDVNLIKRSPSTILLTKDRMWKVIK